MGKVVQSVCQCPSLDFPCRDAREGIDVHGNGIYLSKVLPHSLWPLQRHQPRFVRALSVADLRFEPVGGLK